MSLKGEFCFNGKLFSSISKMKGLLVYIYIILTSAHLALHDAMHYSHSSPVC